MKWRVVYPDGSGGSKPVEAETPEDAVKAAWVGFDYPEPSEWTVRSKGCKEWSVLTPEGEYVVTPWGVPW